MIDWVCAVNGRDAEVVNIISILILPCALKKEAAGQPSPYAQPTALLFPSTPPLRLGIRQG
ncbi:hypothetical protein N7539_008513 [Penicillium diatomitis]|uniref:Uncharacterized protein n=1 Tax=Penicillium diatomitis TaxID=2819901 RepID=A0A9W9WQX4_9EURO|nr:uncharacterized protein N7539_008513 [Penicillium diatomitis]KAJ5471944.1 hypothetical protein N7539_008513 [Penicillium diatomitis]